MTALSCLAELLEKRCVPAGFDEAVAGITQHICTLLRVRVRRCGGCFACPSPQFRPPLSPRLPQTHNASSPEARDAEADGFSPQLAHVCGVILRRHVHRLEARGGMDLGAFLTELFSFTVGQRDEDALCACLDMWCVCLCIR